MAGDPPMSFEAMAATPSPPRILPSGDSAITVEFSRNIDDAANQRVLALDHALATKTIAAVTETVPIGGNGMFMCMALIPGSMVI